MHTFYNSKERWRTEEGSPFRLSDGRLVDSEEEELALIYESEEHVYFARPNADETGGTAMFLKRNGDELELSSDNFFAYAAPPDPTRWTRPQAVLPLRSTLQSMPDTPSPKHAAGSRALPPQPPTLHSRKSPPAEAAPTLPP